MRIGIITGEYPPLRGGVGAYSRIVADKLGESGHKVFILSNQVAQEPNPNIELSNTVRKWGAGSLRTIREWARTNRLDIVNLQYQTAAFAMSPWIHFIPDALRGILFVTTFHDLLFPYLFPKAGSLRNWIVLRLARASTGRIATNHEDLGRLKHLPNSRLIPIGSNILTRLSTGYDRAKWRAKAGASPEEFLLAHFGFVNRSKGLESLFTALAHLRQGGLPARLMMIGGRTGSSDPANRAYVDEIDTLIARLDVGSQVYWTGYVDDNEVSAFLAACDVVVLPFRDGASYRRGSLMAAIQHGCAIVTTEPKVVVPTFRHGKNMMLCCVDDVSSLTTLLSKLSSDPELCETLRAGARDLQQHFDWDSIAQNYAKFFEELIGERG